MSKTDDAAPASGEGFEPISSTDEGRSEKESDPTEQIDVGKTVKFTKKLADEDVRTFAQVSGDTNRLHVDEDFAAETRFGRRIVHGTLASGLISAALARLPGLTIYLSQDVRFVNPIDVGVRLTAVVEVVEELGADRYRLATKVSDDRGERVVDGEATVLIDPSPDGPGTSPDR